MLQKIYIHLRKKIELVTNIFKFVIITGRTQLFQDEISEPDEGIIKEEVGKNDLNGNESMSHHFRNMKFKHI